MKLKDPNTSFWDDKGVVQPVVTPDTYKGTILINDADITAFQASATCDGRLYKVRKSAKNPDVFFDETFKYHKDAVAFCKHRDLDHTEHVAITYDPEPESYAFRNVQQMLKSIKDMYPGATLENYLTGKGNFRNDLHGDYKENRVGKRRPHHLTACKQFIVNHHGGKSTDYLEADDLVSIRAWECRRLGIPYVVVSIDKDLNMVPGEHLNPSRGESYTISEQEALLNFYTQCLIGDSTDNIYGLKGVGPIGARNILKPVAGGSEYDMFQAVKKAWLGHKDHKKLTKEEILEMLAKTSVLLYILREPFVLWQPPTKPSVALTEPQDKLNIQENTCGEVRL